MRQVSYLTECETTMSGRGFPLGDSGGILAGESGGLDGCTHVESQVVTR